MPSAHIPRTNGTARAVEQLVGMSLLQHSLESVLQAVADLNKEVMPGNPEASVSIRDSRQEVTVASTGQLARDLDEAQLSADQGPCLHAAATGELTEVPDTRTETRWADYMRHAVEHGNLSSLSVPLVIDGDVSGSLNIYARQANAFDDDARSAAIGFAPYAAVAVKNMHDYEAAQVRARELAAGAETPAAIDQATGILMERHAMTADEAFRLLSEVSARTGTTLREAAHVLVDTGEMPELARP